MQKYIDSILNYIWHISNNFPSPHIDITCFIIFCNIYVGSIWSFIMLYEDFYLKNHGNEKIYD